MAIRAMIMAGGEGIRLRPMTCTTPKPLVPMLGRPLLAYTLELIRKHGIGDVGVTLCYQAKKIRAFLGKKENEHLRITCFEETCPMGTAGSIRMAQEQLEDTFFVLSGDGLTDCDLTDALEFHRKKRALATLVLKRVKVPLQYGVVMTGEDGRIQRFLEKPDWSHAYSNLVNTGIYILNKEIFDHISPEGMPDFGRDIFPLLLQKKLPMYGYEMQGYWCDVGNQEAYLSAQMDLLQGKMDLLCQRGVDRGATIQAGVHLQGLFTVGKGTEIESGAVIKNAVIGENCRIGSGAVIEDCCLWNGVQIGAKARLEGCVACDESAAKGGAVLRRGCSLGQGAQAGAHTVLHAGVKLWPCVKTPSGAVLTESMQETGNGCIWEEDGVLCRSADHACRLAAAFVKAAKLKNVITGHQEAPGMQAVVTGAMEVMGVQVKHGETMTAGMLGEMVTALKADGGMLAREDKLVLVDENGVPVSSDIRRKMEGAYLEGGGRTGCACGEMSRLSGVKDIYFSRVLPAFRQKPLLSAVALYCENGEILKTAAWGLKKLGARKVRCVQGDARSLREGETGFLLSEDGRQLDCITEKGPVDRTQVDLLRLKLMAEQQGCMYDLPDVPRSAGRMYTWEQADESELCLCQQRRMEDGLAGLWMIGEAMKEGPLEMLLEAVPGTSIVCREVNCPEQDKSRILYALCKKAALPYTLKKGMQVQHEKGYATIVPDGIRPAVRIVSEAADMETANELCDFYDREIRRVLETEADF